MASTPERNRAGRCGGRERSNEKARASAVNCSRRPVGDALKPHLNCASHREAATRFACANIQNARRVCGRFSLIVPCSSLHFVRTSGGNCSHRMQCMPHLWRSHCKQTRSTALPLVGTSSCPITFTFLSADPTIFNSADGSEC